MLFELTSISLMTEYTIIFKCTQMNWQSAPSAVSYCQQTPYCNQMHACIYWHPDFTRTVSIEVCCALLRFVILARSNPQTLTDKEAIRNTLTTLGITEDERQRDLANGNHDERHAQGHHQTDIATHFNPRILQALECWPRSYTERKEGRFPQRLKTK